MLLLPSLAHKIILEVKKLLKEDIIIVDLHGHIIAGTDENRIGQFHEGALRSIEERQTIVITENDHHTLRGVKPGINLPLFLSQEVIGVIGITGNPSEISNYGELLRKMTELLIQDTYYTEQTQWHLRMLESFVFDWMQLREWSAPFLERARILNVDLTTTRQVLLMALPPHHSLTHADIWQLQHLWHHEEDLFIPWGADRLLIIHAVHPQRDIKETLDEWRAYLDGTWGSSIRIGVGQQVSPHHLRTSYEQSNRALSVTTSEHPIAFDHDLRLEMCLENISKETKRDFSHRVLHALENYEDLLETGRALLQHNMALKQTAQALHIHINTLHYRMKKIEELASIDLKRTSDIVTFYLAFHFLDDHLKNKE